jgi:hypothetical protein
VKKNLIIWNKVTETIQLQSLLSHVLKTKLDIEKLEKEHYHTKLVDSYKRDHVNFNGFHDDYFYLHISDHMQEANLEEQLTLLRKSNGFYEEHRFARDCFSFNIKASEVLKFFDAIEKNDLTQFEILLPSQPMDIRKYFYTEWANTNELMSPMQRACYLGREQMVTKFLDIGVSPNQMGSGGSSYSTERDAIMFATEKRHVDIVKLLLDAGGKLNIGSCVPEFTYRIPNVPPTFGDLRMLSINSSGWINLYPIQTALLLQDNAMISLLLPVSNLGQSPNPGFPSCLHIAASFNNFELVQKLLGFGAKPEGLQEKYPSDFTSNVDIKNLLKPLEDENLKKKKERNMVTAAMLQSGEGLQIFVKSLTGKLVLFHFFNKY